MFCKEYNFNNLVNYYSIYILQSNPYKYPCSYIFLI